MEFIEKKDTKFRSFQKKVRADPFFVEKGAFHQFIHHLSAVSNLYPYVFEFACFCSSI